LNILRSLAGEIKILKLRGNKHLLTLYGKQTSENAKTGISRLLMIYRASY